MPLDLSYDPLDRPASLGELKSSRIANLEAPITVAAGYTFQYAEQDERTMRKALVALKASDGATVPWRQLNNVPVTVNAAQLEAYLSELDLLQAKRGLIVDAEYMVLKEDGSYTRRQLANWVKKYAAGAIPA